MTMTQKENLVFLKETITKQVFISGNDHYIESGNKTADSWVFDFRKIILTPKILDAYVDIFFDKFKEKYPFQVGGLEVAAIPLVAAIVAKSTEYGMPVNGFFIRKSRKKTGLLNIIEGIVTDDPIILVDDIINSGSSFIRQIEILDRLKEEAGRDINISQVFSILRFKPLDSYTYFHEKKIRLETLFTLDEFQDSFKYCTPTQKPIVAPNLFDIKWHWQANKPSYQYVCPKSAPVYSKGKLFVGSDSGEFFCLDANTGSVIWSYLIPIGGKQRIQFSTPCVTDTSVYFGSYDGNIYSFDKETGERSWVFMEGDWIESSPCLNHDNTVLYVTLRYGFFKKEDKLVAIDVRTGGKLWETNGIIGVLASPTYSQKNKLVYCGDSEGNLYAFSTQDGKLKWKSQTSLKAISAPTLSPDSTKLIYTGLNNDEEDDNGSVYILDASNGKTQYIYNELFYGCHSSALVYKTSVIIGSLDKNVYSFELDTGKTLWKIDTGARVFAEPALIKSESGDKLYIGSNNAVLYEINPINGEITSMTYVTERIVNRISHNTETNTLYIPTFANEIYALKRK